MSTPTLDQIAAHGNRRYPIAEDGTYRGSHIGPNWITCKDGFRLSVIAGYGAYSIPRPGFVDGESDYYPGPYSAVEVMCDGPVPWDSEDGCDTVHGFVSVEDVRALIESHGGEA